MSKVAIFSVMGEKVLFSYFRKIYNTKVLILNKNWFIK